VGLTTLPPSRIDRHEIWEPQPPGTHMGCTGFALPLAFQNRTEKYGIHSVSNASGEGGSGLRRCVCHFRHAIDGYASVDLAVKSRS
jgi:hypothetical protein